MNDTFTEAAVSIRGARKLTSDVNSRTEQISRALDIDKIKNIKRKAVNTRERGKTRLTTILVLVSLFLSQSKSMA